MQHTYHTTQPHYPDVKIVKHDIRNRLSALKLNLYVLERQGHPEQHDALIKMKEELGLINELLEDIHDNQNK